MLAHGSSPASLLRHAWFQDHDVVPHRCRPPLTCWTLLIILKRLPKPGMLTLKDHEVTNKSLPKRRLLDLPDELLDHVISILYTDNGRFKRDLIPSSLSCSRLRAITAPVLFETIHVRLTRRYVDRRTFNIFLNLDLAPHTFARHVRHIKQNDSFCFRENGCEDLRLSNDLVKQVILQGLRSVIKLRTIR